MNKKAFGKQLQKYREQAGYSQEALAEQIECSTIFISYMERGIKSPSMDTLIKLSNQLHVSADLLLGNELTGYSSEKMKDIAQQLQTLPPQEQNRILEIIDTAVSIETRYCQRKR